eukprot:1114777-Rhodomonas_salina.3
MMTMRRRMRRTEPRSSTRRGWGAPRREVRRGGDAPTLSDLENLKGLDTAEEKKRAAPAAHTPRSTPPGHVLPTNPNRLVARAPPPAQWCRFQPSRLLLTEPGQEVVQLEGKSVRKKCS